MSLLELRLLIASIILFAAETANFPGLFLRVAR